jgi:hypothetical protein
MNHWVRLAIVILAMLVVGNAATTLILYTTGQPQLTAWTGHVPQSTPSAANDLLLGIVLLIIGISILRSRRE